ncbi:hypothetical protein D623_10006420 [Myotis brandtii]|uniref:Uncharacterized protein n=1 Tax=Myotis brandtii TaxID=109478 RepID=S7MUG2_MYOBR|nr:hypothetical protein D623_10006420 [Myotis brandtii]
MTWGQDRQCLCKGSSQEGQGSESSGQGSRPCKRWAETQEALHRHPDVQVPGGALAVPAASKGRRLRAKALQGGSVWLSGACSLFRSVGG